MIDSQDLLAKLLQWSVNGVLAVDEDRRVVLWNPALERIFGMSRDEAHGLPISQALPFLEENPGEPALSRALAGEPVTEGPRRFVLTGREGWFEARYAPLRDISGTIVGALVVVRDVTEIRRLRGALEATRFRRSAREAKPEAPPNEAVETETEADVDPMTFDLEVVIGYLGGEEGLLIDMVDIFIAALPEMLDELERAVSTGSAEETIDFAQRLKGTAAALGALKTTTLAAELEMLGKEGQLDRAPRVAARLREELNRLVRALNVTLRRPAA